MDEEPEISSERELKSFKGVCMAACIVTINLVVDCEYVF